MPYTSGTLLGKGDTAHAERLLGGQKAGRGHHPIIGAVDLSSAPHWKPSCKKMCIHIRKGPKIGWILEKSRDN